MHAWWMGVHRAPTWSSSGLAANCKKMQLAQNSSVSPKHRARSLGFLLRCAQTAFIVNATIRENVLFGQPLDQLLYDKCLDICCLVPDLEILPGGDSCEIGEQVRADSNANVFATLVALACCALRAYAACAVRQSE